MLEFTDIQSSVFQYASFRNAKGGIYGAQNEAYTMMVQCKLVIYRELGVFLCKWLIAKKFTWV